MKISNRLLTIASFIKDNAFVMDVGADHGLLEIYLFDNNKIKSVVAVENKEGPYSILVKSLEGRDITCLLSDGIKDISPEVDTVVIAGMGGNLIVDILAKDISKLRNVRNIIVDAHKDNELVRRELVKLGYKIEKEKIVYENKKYYFVISFVKGTSEYSQNEYEFGYKTDLDPLFENYRQFEINRLSSDLEKTKSAKQLDKKKIQNLEAKIVRLKNYGNN